VGASASGDGCNSTCGRGEETIKIRRALVVGFVFVLSIFLLTALSGFACSVEANFMGTIPTDYPLMPNKEPPILEIESPANRTYHQADISLNFTLTLPDSWGRQNHVNDVNYELDGQAVNLGRGTTYDPTLPKTHPFSAILERVAEGQHELKINVDSIGFTGSSPPKDYEFVTTKTVFFTVDRVDNVPEFPSWLILPLFLIVTLVTVFCSKTLRARSRRS
jgi:hypothetical protein